MPLPVDKLPNCASHMCNCAMTCYSLTMGVVFATYSVQQCATVCNSVQLCAQYSSNIKNTKLCNDNELCIAQYSCAATSAWELGHLGTC